MRSISRIQSDDKCEVLKLRTEVPGAPGQSRAPRTTDLISLLFITGSFGVWSAQQVTAASAAAATQPTPAAGASGEVRSQAKNQAFPSFLILQASLRCPGLVYIPSSPGKSRCISKFFSQKTGILFRRLHGFSRRAPGATEPRFKNKNGRNLYFFTGVSEFASGPAAHPELQEIPASGSWELFWEFSGVFEEFRSLDSCIWAPGARCELRDLSTGYPQFSLY